MENPKRWMTSTPLTMMVALHDTLQPQSISHGHPSTGDRFPVQDLETRASNDSGQGNTLPTSRCCLGTAFWRTMKDLRSEESDWLRKSKPEKAAQGGSSPQRQKT